MSHPEQRAFLSLVARANPRLIEGARILEIGSYDVNGTARKMFAGAGEHVGIDLTEGPGVDRVMFGHEVNEPDGAFDIAISGECFEHDRHWRETFTNMVRMTRPGGLVAFTCASTGRPEHGTVRTDPGMSPGTQAVGSDYYRNLSSADFASLPLDEWFGECRFWYLPTSLDLYFAGVRKGKTPQERGVLPSSHDVEALTSLMPWGHKLVRYPLRWASRHGEGHRFQDRALLYWRAVLAFGEVAGRLAPGVFRRSRPNG